MYTSTINKVYLIMKLFNLKMLENINFKQHLNEFASEIDCNRSTTKYVFTRDTYNH